MMNIVSKSANLAPYLKTSSQAVASQLKPLVAPVVVASSKNAGQPSPVPTTSYSMSRAIPDGAITVRAGPAGNLVVHIVPFSLTFPCHAPLAGALGHLVSNHSCPGPCGHYI